MFTRCERPCVLSTITLCLGLLIATGSTVIGREPDKVTRKTYNVQRLMHKNGLAELECLITEVIEPQSWMMMGGQGVIMPKGKGSITVVQTPEIQKKTGDLLKALGELPPLRKSRNRESNEKATRRAEDESSKKQSSASRPTSQAAKRPSQSTEAATGDKSTGVDPSEKSAVETPKAEEVKRILEIRVDEEPTADPAIVIYYVKDLAGTSGGLDLESLIERLVSTVAPKSWMEQGGTGVVMAYPKGRALVVRQSRKVHSQLSKALEDLYRMRLQKTSMGAGGGLGGLEGGPKPPSQTKRED